MAEPKYFTCEPNKLCEGARCCTSKETKPALSIGDYFRLGSRTLTGMETVWREQGDVAVVQLAGRPRGTFGIALGLLHDPCPYLTPTFSCGVYEQKPTGCSLFPTDDLNGQQPPGIFATYQCLKGVTLSPDQQRRASQLREIQDKEARIEFRYFWREKPPTVDLRDTQKFFDFASHALKAVEQRPHSPIKMRRLDRLCTAVTRLKALMDQDQLSQGIDAYDYRELASAVVYPCLEEDITQRFATLDDRVLNMLQETTRELEQL